MKNLPVLRRVDDNGPDKVRARLTALGYQPGVTEVPADSLYFQFAADFTDGALMTGYIDRISWMNHALPQLAGIDWFSVDEHVLSQLVSATPFELSLTSQHADLCQARIVGWHRDQSQLIGLPALPSMAGKVSIAELRLGSANPLVSAELAQKLTVPLVFVLGLSRLRLQTLAKIKVGDVLLIERMSNCVKTHDKKLFSFELTQEVIMIHSADGESDEKFSGAGELGQSSDLNSLPIELSFILLEKTVTLGELNTLIPGEVLTLPPDTLMDVEIRANQRCFARGELIQLSDGRLGIEIRKIWP